MHICPVCKKHEFEEILPLGSFKRCPICGWCDDYYDEYSPHHNDESENEYSLVNSIRLYNEVGTTLVPYEKYNEITKNWEREIITEEELDAEDERMYEYLNSLIKKENEKRKDGFKYEEFLIKDDD